MSGRRWTTAEDDALRSAYRASGAGAVYRRLAIEFRRTPGALQARAGELGVRRQNLVVRRLWTPAEDERLMELLARHTTNYAAQLLGRSNFAVKVRAQVLGVSTRDRDGWYSTADVAHVFGTNSSWVHERIKRGLLKVEREGGAFNRISEKALRDFVVKFPGELQGRCVQMSEFVGLLAGA